MKRANGAGSVYKLSGKRRKPWIARFTTGYDDQGNQTRLTIGTYATKKEAQTALDAYLYVPERPKEMTIKEAFDGWKEQTNCSIGTIQAYESSFRKLKRFYNINTNNVDLDMLQDAVDTPPVTYNTAKMIKKVLSSCLDYAFAHDCCAASRVGLLKYIKMPEKEQKAARQTFTDDEIQKCIDDRAFVAVILLFTGLRRDEFLNLKLEDIHLDQGWLHVSKSKTAAGIRDVPIPDRLIPFFKIFIDSGLIGMTRRQLEVHWWQEYNCLQNHTRHECRHTYITKLTEAGIDQRYIKMIVGHAGTITEDIYSHVSMDKLRAIVNDVFGPLLPPDLDAEGYPVYDQSSLFC